MGQRSFQVEHTLSGAMVVYGSAYGVFGHIATVRARAGRPLRGGRAELLDFDPNLETHWATFDLRSIGWPDPAVVGFIDAPPLG